MTTLIPVNKETEITVGMALIEVHARRGRTFNKLVKRVTKNFIMTQDGQKYTREGYSVFDDSGKRDLYTRLHIEN